MMHRLLLLPALVLVPAWAGGLSGPTEGEAAKGLKEALSKGVEVAVGRLSAKDGFLGNPKVKIPLPPTLARIEGMLRVVGLQKPADELVAAMNRAAETAVVEAKPILLDSLRKLTLADAKAILMGPEDSATQHFRKSSGEAITRKFRPKVAEVTQRVQLAGQYDKVAGKAAAFGLIEKDDANLDDYVTRKAVDGLFLMIAEQEKAIRRDPMGQSSTLIRKIFGAARP